MTNENKPVKEITAIVTWYSTGRRLGGYGGQMCGADGAGPGARLFFGKDGPAEAVKLARDIRHTDKVEHLQVVEAGNTGFREIITW